MALQKPFQSAIAVVCLAGALWLSAGSLAQEVAIPTVTGITIIGRGTGSITIISPDGSEEIIALGSVKFQNQLRPDAVKREREMFEMRREGAVQAREAREKAFEEEREAIAGQLDLAAAAREAAEKQRAFKRGIESDMVQGGIPRLSSSVSRRKARTSSRAVPRQGSPRNSNPGVPRHLWRTSPDL